MRVNIRWMIKRDFPEVLAIERASFDCPWREEDFLCLLRQRNCIGMVAECDGRVVGFMVYLLEPGCYHLENFAVAPDFRGCGVGRQMVRRLIDKLSRQKRDRILLVVRERNLSAQLFFRAVGFRAFCVLHGLYDGSDEDAYAMRFTLDCEGAFMPSNRIAACLDEIESGSKRGH